MIDEFFSWIEKLPVSGKSKFVGAIGYAINEKEYLYTFLENGNVPLDNNRAENAIRPFAVGRKISDRAVQTACRNNYPALEGGKFR